MIHNLSDEEVLNLLRLLNPKQLSHIEGELNKLRSSSEIVDFKRSEPFSLIQFVEQTTILKTLDYHLLEPINVSLLACDCCHNKACVTMEYCNLHDINDNHSFELCLHCFHAVKETPVYASAEGDV